MIEISTTPAAEILEGPKVLIVGHSHGSALQNAEHYLKTTKNIHLTCSSIQLFGRYHDFSTSQEGKIIYNPDLLKEIFDRIEANKPDLILGPLLGSEYYMICFPSTERRFDLIVPGQPAMDVAPGAELVPFDLIHAMAYDAYYSVLGILRHVEERTGIKSIYVVPPPPTSDSAFILSHLPPAMANRFSTLTARQLLNTWHAYTKAAKDICKENGTEFVSSPSQALSDDGFLLRHLAGDGVHGNTVYGGMLMEEIANRFFDVNRGADR